MSSVSPSSPNITVEHLKSAAVVHPIPPEACSTRRFPSPCWTHEEILALIDSYREKWFSLRRGNLRAPQWQEVADAVICRCQHLFDSIPPVSIPKTAVQCRHKVEKLRKRYRTERLKSIQFHPIAPTQSSWLYFTKMDALDISPTIGAKRTTPSPAAPTLSSSSGEDPSSEQSEEDEKENLRESYLMSNGSGSVIHGRCPSMRFQFKVPKVGMTNAELLPNSTNGRRFFEAKRKLGDKRRREEEEEVELGGSAIELSEIASALRILGKGFVRMERLKMDMNREFEKVRMEMELKKTEMILDSQQQIIDTFLTGLIGMKKKRKKKRMMNNVIST